MILGCIELLILLGIIAALFVILGRYPGLGKFLFRPLHNRRISGWQLLLGAFFLGFLAFIVSEKATKPGHPLSAVMYPLLFSAAFVLFVWAMLRFLALPIEDAPPADHLPRSRPKEALEDWPVHWEIPQLFAALAVRVSRLSIKDLLLAAFLVVAPLVLAIAVSVPVREEEAFAVVAVLLFWWAVCFVVFWLAGWLLRRLSRGACPSISQLKNLIDDRLSKEERARLATHVELCPVCRHRVEGLTEGKYSWPIVAHKLREQAAHPEPALHKVADKIRGGIVTRVSRFSIKKIVSGLRALVGTVIFPFRLIVWPFQERSLDACPSIDHLKDLLAERVPPDERTWLAAHLELCSICQHRVEGLTAGHKSWPGLARKLSERPATPEPALRKVMEQLKDHSEETTDNEPAFAADLPLGFLSPSDKPEQLGRLERYEVLQEIGRGGMGVVLKAFDPSLHRVVAIKVLAPQLATSGVARKRFLREAKAAAAVTHDHIVTIHAVDEANGLPYLVMQFVPGQSLQERIDKDGPLELTDILRIGMQTASGLAAAHAHGIVHRDIKPANILLEEGVQRVKLTDFGLARAMDDASLTQSGFVAGSPLYMAPEQARGEALDHRADLFSLGSVIYTMCTGRPPFRAANTLAVLRRVSEDAPRPIRETNPEIPDWLADIVAKLMSKEPTERFQSAAEAEEVLGRHLAQLQHAAWVPPPRPPAPPAVPDLPTSVTICPSCGASLHVPERMVGNIVHCAECGKPFHVEDGSEVIQVARPAGWPLRHRSRWRPRLRGCIWIAGAGFVFVILLPLSFYMLASRPARIIRVPMTAKVTAKSSQPLPKSPPPLKPPPVPRAPK